MSKEYVCKEPQCGLVTVSEEEMEDHLNAHRAGKKPIYQLYDEYAITYQVCKICGFKTSSKDVERHITEEHQEEIME